MNRLYIKSNLLELKTKQKKFKILFLCFLFAFVISLVTFILVANFETRTLFSVIGSICSTILFYFFLYFVFKFKYFKRLTKDFEFIMNEKEKTTIASFIDISEKPITLPDKSSAYVVKINTLKGKRTIYLSSLFINDLFNVNSRYKFYIVSDYIVGFEDAH